jgi:ribosomal protein S27E
MSGDEVLCRCPDCDHEIRVSDYHSVVECKGCYRVWPWYQWNELARTDDV